MWLARAAVLILAERWRKNLRSLLVFSPKHCLMSWVQLLSLLLLSPKADPMRKSKSRKTMIACRYYCQHWRAVSFISVSIPSDIKEKKWAILKHVSLLPESINAHCLKIKGGGSSSDFCLWVFLNKIIWGVPFWILLHFYFLYPDLTWIYFFIPRFKA